jgi:tetratricopeptide (TPR) repeat protein
MHSRIVHFIALGMAAALVMSVTACRHSQQELPTVATKQAAPQAALATARQPLQVPVMGQAVNRDPVDAKGWVALGNRYFDSHQRQKAIAAYGKALQLDPNNPDVLTDQGVMYRELGAFDKAIANFEKASTIDPRHLPSLLNLGVLYAQDLKDEDKAIKTWTHLIQIAPTSIQAARAQAYIDQIKQMATPD